MTQFPDLFSALAAPFDSQEVRVRTQAGRQLHYITARTAMNRLDNVLGPENWWDEFIAGENSVLCRITIRLPDGSVLSKCDAGGYAGMPDQGDDDKSGYSDSFKRAAVKFGVGRYLYRDGVPCFVRDREPALSAPVDHDVPDHRRDPEPGPGPRGGNSNRAPGAAPAGGGNGSVPRSGRALFAWTKEQEQIHQVGLLKYLNGWAKLQDFPGRMIDWDADQVNHAYAEAVRKLQGIANPGRGEAYDGE